jgi:hypothetical protein
MCVLPASHFKVHATLRRDLPMSKVFLRISFALGGAYFALGGVRMFSPVAWTCR